MPNEWSFRSEILLATQRWPWLALICVAGALLGWLISLAWPTPHRATRELYVGLNAYRALNDRNAYQYAGIKLMNANDYKNWQMDSLNSLIFMDGVINQTLAQLRESDIYWQSVTSTDLANSLHVYWRNAGKWRLVAENKDPQHAAEAVSAWQDVVVNRVHEAVLESQQAMVLEFQLRALAASKTQLLSTTEAINRARDDLENWQADLHLQPADSIVDPAEHWSSWQPLARLEAGPDWDAVLETFPAEGSSTQAYLLWIDRAISLLDGQIRSSDIQLAELTQKEVEITEQFSQASQKSLGLSASLDVDKISSSSIQQMETRPSGMLMLAGSLLGLIAWLTLWLSSISLRGWA